jgi:RNA polymerase-binding transcription factor DksA
MTNEKLNEHKKKLEDERRLLVEEIKRNEKPVDLGIDIVRFEEESDEAEEVSTQLAIAGDLKNRMDDINNALQKIGTGKYGICEKCGEPIEEEILNIDPESRFCKKDKVGK